MAALAANKHVKRKEPRYITLPVAASTIIYAGAMCMANAAGTVVPGADTAAHSRVGIATEKVDNSAGAAGALECKFEREGVYQFAYSGTAPNIGDTVYFVDDQTVGIAATTTNDIKVGVAVTDGASSLVWVDIAQ